LWKMLAGVALLIIGWLTDPDPITEEEREQLIKAIASSRWARGLAEAMATTPEARELVSRYLAKEITKRME